MAVWHTMQAIISTEVTRDSVPLNASVLDAMLHKHGAMQFNEFFAGTEDDVQTVGLRGGCRTRVASHM